ncbi:MAG: exo-beta-N-acetylmuramidase NamZ domain-containing protein [bacterium]
MSVKPGISVLMKEQQDLIAGKRVGLITNSTGITPTLISTADVISKIKPTKLTALFGPEHGIRGDIFAGDNVETYTDKKTGVPVYSLYGNTKKPANEMLANLDMLIFDIQDIGARYYTYIYTMAYAMESAKEKGIPFIVLDRPNPINGHLVEGPVLDSRFSSFIGLYQIPIVHGLTVGELAQLFNQEFKINCDLQIVPMKGWKRRMLFADTKLPWVATSPHLPQSTTAWHYATTGFIGELHTICIGVGYTLPFEIVGATWIDGEKLAKELNQRKLPGVKFRPVTFRPYYYIFKDQVCQGVQIHIMKLKDFLSVSTGLHILATIYKMYPEQVIFPADLDQPGSRLKMFYQAMGSDSVHKMLEQGKSAAEIIDSWQDNLNRFKTIREKYLIY